MGVTLNLVGQRFHQLTVEALQSRGGPTVWRCRCDCGAEALVPSSRLRSGKTKSCGCRRAANMRCVARKHGNSGHLLYVRWLGMHRRCYDPENNRYYRYGARGIKVCERWHSFELYLEDVLAGYRPGLTVDREDNDGNYEPSNIRWATYRMQAKNRPSSFITDDEIAEMRAMYSAGGITQREVGEVFGYGREAVKHYLRGLRG